MITLAGRGRRLWAHILLAALAAIGLGAGGPARAAEEAKLALYVFERGQPVEGVQTRVGGVSSGTTNADGAAVLTVPPGRYPLTLHRGQRELLSLDLLTQAGEHVQIIVTLPDGPRPPDVEIESSRTGPDAEATGTGGDQPKGPPGTVSGQVTDLENGEPVAGARIFISGVGLETETDADGRFSLEVPPGSYSLSVIHSDYSTQTLDHLQVTSEETVQADMSLSPAGVELADYVVVAPYIEGSIESVIRQQRDARSVTEVIGAEQMTQAGDSDAADALTRVTGLTVERGKFVLIRGLPPRYTKTLWNGSALPSPDPNGRLVPLDLIPKDTLKSVQVQKSYSADRPGSFGGGLVQLETRGLPEADFFDVGLSLGHNSETTTEEGLIYEGGERDAIGFDDGTRELPRELDRITDEGRRLARTSLTNPNGFTPEELETLGESLPNIYQARDTTVPPDFGFDLAGGKVFEGSTGEFGLLGSLIYDNGWQNKAGPERTFSKNGDELQTADDYDVLETENTITIGGLFTGRAEFGEDSSLTSNTFVIRKSTDAVRTVEGRRSENDEDVREVVLDWVETQLVSQQLVLSHVFSELGGLEVDWRMMVAETRREAPDRRFYRYILLEPPVLDGSSLERRWAELEDSTESMGLDFTLPIGDSAEDAVAGMVKTGFSKLRRERTAEVKRFQFEWRRGSIPEDIGSRENPEDIFSKENIGEDGFVIDDLTGANDDSSGTEDEQGVYLAAELTLFDTFTFNAGVRKEMSTIFIRTFQAAEGSTEAPVESTLDTTAYLPAYSALWRISDEMQLRAGYGKSIARPDFREISPAQFIDPETNDTFVGNPNLVQTEIESWDLRWEWYFSASEHVTAGIFRKEFTNPIETVRIPGFSAPRTFQNADVATASGIEVGYRKDFGFLGAFWEDFYTSGNVAVIDSTVELVEDSVFTNTNQTRQLQGQAPFIFNFKVGYSGERTDANLLFNLVGERIQEVGVQGQPDVKLQPEPRLDFVLQHEYDEDITLKLSAKNLLNPEVEYLQGDEVQRSYKRGRSIGLSVGVSF